MRDSGEERGLVPNGAGSLSFGALSSPFTAKGGDGGVSSRGLPARMSDLAKHERKLCFEILFASVAAGGDSSEVLAHAVDIELGRELEQALGVEPILSLGLRVLRLEALEPRLGVDERAVHAEVFRPHQTGLLRLRYHLAEEQLG